MKREAEQKKLHQMAKVHNIFEMWLGSLNLWATQNESHGQNEQMTAVGYISDTEAIVKALWSHFQHDGAAALKLSKKSPVPPALSSKKLPGGQTRVLNVRRINPINRHLAESEEDHQQRTIPSGRNGCIIAVSNTRVKDCSAPGANTMHRVAYHPPIAVSPFLLALSVSHCKRTLWRWGQLWP